MDRWYVFCLMLIAVATWIEVARLLMFERQVEKHIASEKYAEHRR